MILDMCSTRNVLIHMLDETTLFKELIADLLTIGEEDPIPSSKELQQRLFLSPAQLSKQLRKLYENFWTLLQKKPRLIQPQKVIHRVYAYGREDRTAYFQCQLPVTPRIGERVTFPFLRGKTGTDYYHVSDVEYVYEQEALCINVTLETGGFNRYFVLSKDRLKLERKVGLRESFDLADYQWENLIRKHY